MEGKVKQWEMILADRVQFWVLLGPIFLLLSLFLTSLSKGTIPNFDLWVVVMIGFILCWSYPTNGFIISFTLLIFSMAGKHYFLSSHHLWQFGLESSVALGLFITSSSFKKMMNLVKTLDTNRQNLLENIALLEEELKKEEALHLEQHRLAQDKIERIKTQLEEKEVELLSLKNLHDSVKDTHTQAYEEKQSLAEECLAKTKEIALLKEKLSHQEKMLITKPSTKISHDILQELTELQNQRVKTKTLEQIISKLFFRKTNTDEDSEVYEKRYDETIDEYEQHLSDKKRFEHLYKQLKSQFKQKSDLLHEARKEVFTLQEKLSVIKLNQTEEDLEPSAYHNELIERISMLEKELTILEAENEQLENIIDVLSSSNIKSSKNPKVKYHLEEQDLPF